MTKINQIEPIYGIEEKKGIIKYLDSGGWLTEFKKTREFEEALCRYTGSKYSSVVSSGTAALFIALKALDISAGDEVIVPDYTMIATANAVSLAGARPVFADIEERSLCADPGSVMKAATPKTRCVIHVSINGRAGEIDRIKRLCRKRGLYLIEDAAQSMGSFHKGRHLGTLGSIGCFSFSMPKIVTTGQGGALVTDNKTLYRRILRIKDFGRSTPGTDRHEAMGWNFKFTDLQAVVGIEQMKRLPVLAEKKKRIFGLYKKLLNGIPGIDFIPTDLEDVTPWFVDILVRSPSKLTRHLQRNGIGSRRFYPALHKQPPYRAMNGGRIYPASERVSRRGLWLPSSASLKKREIGRICRAIKKCEGIDV